MTFNVRDMRFFQQFLTSLPHALPIGNRSVWLTDLPQLANEHSFLMHAMLALGASELDQSGRASNMRHDMLTHRGKAILGLRDAIEGSPEMWRQAGHADAVLAACYSLCYQASHLSDALLDFDVFMQGCALATDKIRRDNFNTALNVDPDWPKEKVAVALQHLQHQSLDVPVIHRALSGIDEVLMLTSSPYCFGEYSSAKSVSQLTRHDTPHRADEYSFWQGHAADD
jgi:hypothetical protein